MSITKATRHVNQNEGLIFEKSSPGKAAWKLPPLDVPEVDVDAILGSAARKDLGEMPEVLVARYERNVVVDADLGDQRVGEPGLYSLRPQLRPQLAGPFPITRPDLELRDRAKVRRILAFESGIAEQLGKHYRRHHHRAMHYSVVQNADVLALIPG